MTISDLNKKLCTGCFSCEESCPLGAISIQYDQEGFPSPYINNDMCVDCGRCAAVCPILSKLAPCNNAEHGFVCCAKNSELAYLSASGGAFAVLADYYITELHGVVFGACMDDDFVVRHHGSESDLKMMQGSKYVQSHTNGCFRLAKKYLDSGRYVLFSGTPCQIAGLKSYLQCDYEHLLTVDIVCHGVASPKLFVQYIKYLEGKYHKRVVSYRFRNKNRYDAGGYVSKIIFDTYPPRRICKTTQKLVHSQRDIFFHAYLKGYIFRESCYECRFACHNRLSDLTLGDCNTADLYPAFHPGEAKSIVLCNTVKGEELFDYLNSRFDFCVLNIQKERLANKQLCTPFKKPVGKDSVLSMLLQGQFDGTKIPELQLTTKQKVRADIQMMVPWSLRSCISRKLKWVKGNIKSVYGKENLESKR